MADEASPPETTPSNPVTDEKPKKDPKVEKPSEPKDNMKDIIRSADTKDKTPVNTKPYKDFGICIGLLFVFGLICVVGFLVLRVTTFSEDEKAEILTSRRIEGFHGVVNPDDAKKKS